MFRCKTAWFSSSVPRTHHDFWTLEGGTVAGWRSADYLFSEHATCPDTLRIFESKDYLWNKVTVFHSFFLSVCEKRQSVKSVCIGHFALPPASVQDEVRNVTGKFIWECEGEPPVAEGAHRSFSSEDEYSEGLTQIDSEPSDADSSEIEVPHPVTSMLTGYVHMSNLQKYTGDLCDLCDFHPRCVRCSRCKVMIQTPCCLPHT